MWRFTEPLVPIDLGWDYYIAKFILEENRNMVLHEGPWFLTGNFLSVR